VSDHQQPCDPATVDPAVLELCRGVDVLVHDAQYTPDEYDRKADWGHCTIDYAVHVAAMSGARRLVLFHHDPEHDDDTLDLLTLAAAEAGSRRGVPEVLAAAEGLRLSLAPACRPLGSVAAPVARPA
jgi:ribonuclease BN (tRNA processing enzyme)